MPSYFEVTGVEFRHLQRLRLAADGKSWTSKVSSITSEKKKLEPDMDSFVVDDYGLEVVEEMPKEPISTPLRGKKLQSRISIKSTSNLQEQRLVSINNALSLQPTPSVTLTHPC